MIFAGEGMWLPHLLKQLNEAEMQSMGMKMTAEDIYSVNNGSLKDAIVHFGGFCTGEVISSRGLVLTNHHCGYGRIQSHSSLDNNLLKDGFWASSAKNELPNPGLFVTFIQRIEEVTDDVLKGTENLTAKEKQSQIDKNIDNVIKKTSLGEFESAIVKPFYYGNQYFLFVTVTYNDVRLVGAPPSSIGKFGADTDNWEWPRHTGDFALFRIYADKDNNPAEYSEDNVPYKPAHHLPISLDGVEEGDFTLVFGFPGRTEQYLPEIAVKHIIEEYNPAKINIREKVLSILDEAMRQDPAIQIKYASKYASVANYYKKWIGENQGLLATNALQKKRDYEVLFMERVNTSRLWRNDYGSLLADLNMAHEQAMPLRYVQEVFYEIIGRNADMMRLASVGSRIVNVGNNGGIDAIRSYWAQVSSAVEGIYDNFDPKTDAKVYAQLIELLVDKLDSEYIPQAVLNIIDEFDREYYEMASQYYQASILTDFERFSKLIENENEEAVIEILSNDPVVGLYTALLSHYNETVAGDLEVQTLQIKELQKQYMAAQMDVMGDRRFWPDANSTLRVTYGNVDGYRPRDAVKYKPKTYLSGVIEKYVPGDYEFDLPQRLIDLHTMKDFGDYTDETGDVPVCFLGSNHTTGGNSGSPAIDAYGNLVGLNFDRVWEGTMSDINYDESICRNIMVDARYIVFIIDKFANARNIVNELTLVFPKSGKKPTPPKADQLWIDREGNTPKRSEKQ